jgi:hypothetical protein
MGKAAHGLPQRLLIGKASATQALGKSHDFLCKLADGGSQNVRPARQASGMKGNRLQSSFLHGPKCCRRYALVISGRQFHVRLSGWRLAVAAVLAGAVLAGVLLMGAFVVAGALVVSLAASAVHGLRRFLPGKAGAQEIPVVRRESHGGGIEVRDIEVEILPARAGNGRSLGE